MKLRSAWTTHRSTNKCCSGRKSTHRESGVALIIITLIVALATALVVQLAHSTFLSGRSVGMVERQLESEYILKSLINFGIALIDSDASPGADAREDFWAIFLQGEALPPSLTDTIGLTPLGVQASLEITPLDAKFNLNRVGETIIQNSAETVKRATRSAVILRNIFQSLRFDDELLEEDHTGRFPGRAFSSEELVSVLRDYLDTDTSPDPEFSSVENFPSGIDGDPAVEDLLKNAMLDSFEELVRVPGFTPNRVRALAPYVTAHRDARQNRATPARMNFNFTSTFLLQNLHDLIDDAAAQQIYTRATEVNEETQTQGFEKPSEIIAELNNIDSSLGADLSDFVTVNSQYFRIIAAVEYGAQGTYLAQALVSHSTAGVDVEFITVY